MKPDDFLRRSDIVILTSISEGLPFAVLEASAAGPASSIGADAVVLNTVLWPGARIEDGAQLTNCIVYSTTPATGAHHDADI